MNLTTERSHGVSIVHVNEARLMYPLLSEFATTITSLIDSGERRVLLDLSTVTYVDSATIGCLADLYRQATAGSGTLKLAGVHTQVGTMLMMTRAGILWRFMRTHLRPSGASGHNRSDDKADDRRGRY